jgi:hypothetical protein
MPFSATINSWYMVAGSAGTMVVDVWKKAGSVPTVADTIAGSEKPTLTGTNVASDTNLTTWTDVAVTAGDIIGFNVDSCVGINMATLSIGLSL